MKGNKPKFLRPHSKRWRRPKRWRARHLCEDIGRPCKGFRGIIQSAQWRRALDSVKLKELSPVDFPAWDCEFREVELLNP
jgi:hypothetical protein